MTDQVFLPWHKYGVVSLPYRTRDQSRSVRRRGEQVGAKAGNVECAVSRRDAGPFGAEVGYRLQLAIDLVRRWQCPEYAASTPWNLKPRLRDTSTKRCGSESLQKGATNWGWRTRRNT